MKTTFAEIDAAVTAVCERELATPTATRETATAVVAGFHLRDRAAEEAALESTIRRQQAAIQLFQADRAAAKSVCAERGIEPLAIVPTATWNCICEATGLFRLSPDEDGVVGFSSTAFAGIKDARGMTGAQQVEWLAENRRDEYLRRLFPRGVSFSLAPGATSWRSPYRATLVMPVPPPDVADRLLKAKGLDLKVATVADAVAFKETPSELYRRAPAISEAIERWLRDDPIIYFEQGTAAAILAQFGDFPIEQDVVARVLAAENLLRVFPATQVAV